MAKMTIAEFNSAHAGQWIKAGTVRKNPDWSYAFACGNIYVPATMARDVDDGQTVVCEFHECADRRYVATNIWDFEAYLAMKPQTEDGEEFTPPPVKKAGKPPKPRVEFVRPRCPDGRLLTVTVTGLKRKLVAPEWAGAKVVTVGIEYHVTVTTDETDDTVSASGAVGPMPHGIEAGTWELRLSRELKLADLLNEDGEVIDQELLDERLRGVAEAALAEMMAH